MDEWAELKQACTVGDATAPPLEQTTDHSIGPVPVELGLGDFQGGIEVVVGDMGIEDLVAVVTEEGPRSLLTLTTGRSARGGIYG